MGMSCPCTPRQLPISCRTIHLLSSAGKTIEKAEVSPESQPPLALRLESTAQVEWRDGRPCSIPQLNRPTYKIALGEPLQHP